LFKKIECQVFFLFSKVELIAIDKTHKKRKLLLNLINYIHIFSLSSRTQCIGMLISVEAKPSIADKTIV